MKFYITLNDGTKKELQARNILQQNNIIETGYKIPEPITNISKVINKPIIGKQSIIKIKKIVNVPYVEPNIIKVINKPIIGKQVIIKVKKIVKVPYIEPKTSFLRNKLVKKLSNKTPLKKRERQGLVKNKIQKNKNILPIVKKIDVDKKVHFQLVLQLEKTFKKNWYDPSVHAVTYKKDETVIEELITHTYYDKPSTAGSYAYEFNKESSGYRTCVSGYAMNVMDTGSFVGSNQSSHMMRRSFVLKTDWLKYSEGISEKAFQDNDEDMCVYNQLEEILLRPKTGIPKKYIMGKVINKHNLFLYFQYIINHHDLREKYTNFNINSGVSTEMLKFLCNELERNMYAYDANSKCFDSITHFTSKNYSPVVFYKMHEHFYLINDATTIRSIAESNKHSAKKIISTTIIDDKKQEDNNLPITLLDAFDIDTAMELKEGIYLLQQSNLNKEIIKFITKYKNVPQSTSKKHSIIQFKFQEGLIQAKKKETKKYVIISVDTTYGENYSFNDVKNIANKNGIDYVNEGLGSVITKILEMSKRQPRISINTEELIEKSNRICQICKLTSKHLEIDHITPLSQGGSNEIENLQVLCKDCHLEKTTKENELGIYEIKDEMSSFYNETVNKEIMKKNSILSWQFVEKIDHNVEELNAKFRKQKIIQYVPNLDKNNKEIKIDTIFAKEKHTTKIKKVEEIIDDSILDPKHVFKLDMIKCRRNIANYSKYEFPVYSVMDKPIKFSGKLQCGLFYVEKSHKIPEWNEKYTCTREYFDHFVQDRIHTLSDVDERKMQFPLRGCGWYSYPMVSYCLQQKIIRLEDIILEFIPYKKLEKTYFQPIIKTLLKSFESEPSLQKSSVNAFIGLLGRTKNSSSKIQFTMSPNEAANWYNEKHKNEDVFIHNIHLENDEIIYQGSFEEPIELESNKYPIYKQILEMEAIELHKLESLIIENNGVILDRNTDAIRYHRKSEFVPSVFWDKQKQYPKYAKEEVKPLVNESLPHMSRNHHLDYDIFDINWNVKYDYNNSPEEEAKYIIESNKSVHIDGRAGTGKTYIVNKIIDELKEQKIKYLSFSPTNKGARLIKGTTIHSIFYKFEKCKKSLFKLLENVQHILIDEISMMGHDFYKLFILIKRVFPKILFIISGDFEQLPPVKDTWSGDYKNSPAMYQLCDGNRLQLTICRRSDNVLFKLCENVNDINKNTFKIQKNTYKNIAYTHPTRIRINQECMYRFQQEFKNNYVDIEKDENNPKSQNVILSQNMPIICKKTNKKMNILNSELFNVIHINKTHFSIINSENEKIDLDIKDFHKYFYPGFCITVYASQGETYKESYTIHDWNFQHFCNKAKYVALSRSSNIHFIQIA